MASNVEIHVEVVVDNIQNINKIKDRIQDAVKAANRQMDRLGDGSDQIISKEASERIENLQDDVRRLKKQLNDLGAKGEGANVVDGENVEQATEETKRLGQIGERLSQRFDNVFDESIEEAQRLNKVMNQGVARGFDNQEKIEELKNNFSDLRIEASRLKKQFQDTDNVSDELESKFVSMRNRIRRNVEEAQDLSRGILNLGSNVGNLSDQMLETISNVSNLGKRFTSLSDDLRESRKSAKTYTQSLSEIVQNNRELFGSFRRVEQKVADASSQIRRSQGHYAEMNGRVIRATQGLNDNANAHRRVARQAREAVEQMQRTSNASSEAASQQNRLSNETIQASNAARSARRGYDSYNDELTESIRKNFKFISAIGLVSSALFGLQNAFMELLEQSRSFVRVQSVMTEEALRTAGNIEKVRNRIREAAIETGERIDEVGETMFQLLSAGLSLEEGLAGLNSAMNVQVATAGDAREVTKSMAGVYNVFGDQMTETQSKQQALAEIGDVLTGVYKNHQVEISEVTQGLEFASSAANIAGFSFEETASFLAVLNDNMIKSGRAGRSLQRVFTQFANKSEKFKQAFGVGVDSAIPLSEQFVQILEKINERTAKGALNLEELRTRFETFGLRGGPAFIQLARNMDDVNEVMNNIKNNVDGLSDSVAQMAQDSLFRSFQSAKQALLQLGAAAFEGPLIMGLRLIADAVVNIQEVLSQTGLDTFLGNTVVIVGSLIASFQTLLAVSKLLVASFSSLFSIISISTIGTLITRFMTLANATSFLTAAVASFNAAWAFTPGGVVAAGIAVIGSATAAFGFMNESVRELNDQIDRANNEINRLGREIDQVSEFKDNFSSLVQQIQRVGTSSTTAATKIRKMFEQSNLDLSIGGRIEGMSDEEIVRNLTGISENTRIELQQKMKALREEQEKQQDKLLRKQRELLNQQFSLEGFGHSYAESILEMFGAEEVQTVQESNIETQFRNVFSEQRRQFLRASENLDFESQVSASTDFVERFTEANVKRIRGLMDSDAVDGLEEAKEIWRNRILDTFGFDDKVSDFISKSVNRELREGISGVTVPDVSPLRNVREKIVAPLSALRENLETPLSREQTESLIQRVNRAEKSVNNLGETFNVLSQNVGEVTFPTEIAENFINKTVSGVEQSAPELNRALKEAFPDAPVFEGATLISNMQRVVEHTEKFNDEVRDGRIGLTNMKRILQVITRNSESNLDVWSSLRSLINDTMKQLTGEARSNIMADMLNDTLALQDRMTSLNDMIQNFNELRQTRVDRAFQIDLLEKNIGQASKTLENSVESMLKAAEQGETQKSQSIAQRLIGKSENRKEAINTIKELLQLDREITKQEKEIFAQRIENQNALERQRLITTQLEQRHVNTNDTVANQNRLLMQNVNATLEELNVQEKINQGRIASKEGLEEVASLREKILKRVEEIKDRENELNDLRAKNVLRLENIGSLDSERLDSAVKVQQAEREVIRLLDKRLSIQHKINNAQGDRRQNLKETAVSQTDKLISQFNTLQEASREINQQRRELNRVNSERLSIIESISEASENRLSNVREDISSIFQRLTERDQFNFISGLSGATGTNIIEAFRDTDQLSKDLLERLKDGDKVASSFSGQIGKAVEAYQRLVEKNQQFNEDLRQIQNERINVLSGQIESLISSGQVGRAQDLLSDLRQAGTERFGEDPSKLIAFRKRVLQLQKRISEVQREQDEGLFNVDEVDIVQDKVAKIRDMIKQISIIDAFDFEGDVDKLESRLNELKSTISETLEQGDRSNTISQFENVPDQTSESVKSLQQMTLSAFSQIENVPDQISESVKSLQQMILSAFSQTDGASSASSSLNDAIEYDKVAQNIENTQTEAAKDAEVVKNLLKDLKGGDVSRLFINILKSSFTKTAAVFNNIFSSVASNLPNDIREQNLETIKQFNSEISSINRNYANTIDSSERALRQNETSYLDFVDQVRQANQKRFQEELKAQKQLRENIKDRQEIIQEAGVDAIQSAFDSAIDSGSNAIENAIFQSGENDFGFLDPLSTNIKQFQKALGVGEGNDASGVGSILQSGGVTLASGVASASLSIAPTIAGLADPETAERASDVINSLGENDGEDVANFFDRIQKALDEINQALQGNAQEIVSEFVKGVVQTFRSIFSVLIRNLPEILMGVVEGFFQGMFGGGGGTSLSGILGSAGVGAAIGTMIAPGVGTAIGAGIGALGGIFHEGGVVQGGKNVPIVAQGGEGVLSREGMRAIGGAQNLTRLNSGVNIEDMFGRFNQASSAQMSQNIHQGNENNITLNATVDSEDRADQIVDKIDKKLAKKNRDHDSEFSKTL